MTTAKFRVLRGSVLPVIFVTGMKKRIFHNGNRYCRREPGQSEMQPAPEMINHLIF